MTTTENERRRYARIGFETPVLLMVGKQKIEGVLIDISLKGALVRIDPALMPPLQTSGVLHVSLQEGEHQIKIEVQTMHVEGDRAGLLCNRIDLDSVTHLTRLVELNLGSHELLERELSVLITS